MTTADDADELLDGLVMDVVEMSCEDLARIDDGFAAGFWASGALALWRDPDGAVDPPEVDSRLVAEAVQRQAIALLCALARLDRSGLAVASTARAEADRLIAAGVRPPSWDADGDPEPVSAWRVEETVPRAHEAVTTTLVLVFAGDVVGDRTHAVLCDVVDGALDTVHLGPDPVGGPGGLLSVPDEARVQVEAVPVPGAAATVASAVDAAHASGRGFSDESAANLVALVDHLARAGAATAWDPADRWPAPADATEVGSEPTGAVDVEADTAAREVLRSALRRQLGSTPPEGLAATATRILDAARRGEWPAAALVEAVGVSDPPPPADRLVPAVVAAPVAQSRRPIGGLDDEERECLGALEWADWLGAVIGLVRAGAGAAVEPFAMVDMINRCPEVTSNVSSQDRGWVASGFSVAISLWEASGVVVDGRLSDVGAWAMPHGLDRLWEHSAD